MTSAVQGRARGRAPVRRGVCGPATARRRLALLGCVLVGAGGSASAAGGEPDLWFVDVAAQTGTQNPSYGRGCAMVDLDGDGRLDLVNANSGMPNAFLRQLPDGTFTEVSELWGIAPDDRAHWGVLVADFDNDGDPDVYFINGGFSAPQANQLLRNDLNATGRFVDVTASAGDAGLVSQDFGGTALDYDRDGDLDIFLTHTRPTDTCKLLRNDGGLFFVNVTAQAGLTHTGELRHCTAGDFDRDGWPDVAVGCQNGPNLVYRNNGDGTFSEVAAQVGLDSPYNNFGLVLEDFDNDGWLDAYLPKYIRYGDQTSRLLRNRGDGTFEDVTEGSGIGGQTDMGHNTGDIDGDGYPDIYIGTGEPALPHPDVVLRVLPLPPDGFVVEDITAACGIAAGGPTRCHGIAFGDYDNDGDIDIYTNNGGMHELSWPPEPNFLWQRQGSTAQYVLLELIGTVSPRTPVGAHATALLSSGREIHRYLRVGHGFANTNSPWLHFPVPDGESVVRIVIRWPSGLVQTLAAPPTGQRVSVVECPGDLDADGAVGPADLGLLLAGWGCTDCAADLDGDGLAGPPDLGVLLAAWGLACE